MLTKLTQHIKNQWELYCLVLPSVILLLVFHYFPMYGLQIAFKDFSPVKGIMGSEWVGLKYFIKFFESYRFTEILWNTLSLSVYSLIASFPFPIILALVLNQIRVVKFKKTVQTVTYMPYFISVVVVVAMMQLFTSPANGIINNIIVFFGGDPVNFMAEPGWFKSLYVFSGIWQRTGWDSIIYLAALSSVDPSLYEAASIDGANKWHKIIYIDIPSIIPTMIILLILASGNLMNVGFEKVLLMQNDLTVGVSEIINTYTYKVGLIEAQYSYSAAIGLFNTIVNFILLVTLNQIAKKKGGMNLF
ncbi:ABC transporter permease [Vallitalea okinawensis]|uniref:ABC transporter permease n=1 Tax=Vallitalea okinawensis TaxID=2078660 RepID=UPI001FA904FC|nr:ABC transporter permease subunit [Vallitalea okinawensis]